MVFNGTGRLPEGGITIAQAAKISRFPLTISDFPMNDQSLLIKFNGTGWLPDGGMAIAQVTKQNRFPPTISDFPGNDQSLLVKAIFFLAASRRCLRASVPRRILDGSGGFSLI